jgi:hypothetical protein
LLAITGLTGFPPVEVLPFSPPKLVYDNQTAAEYLA